MPTNRPFTLYPRCGGRVCNRAAVVVFLGAFRSPYSRPRRQYGVIHNVTARAVNIAGNQQFAIKSLAGIADAAEVGDWLTQIIQIIMIFVQI